MPDGATLTPAASRARANEILTPYVPRLVIDWLRETPTDLHREVEGSMVFVDISGFTALSERLARQGKIGAELMRDTLNGVFTALLDEAYDYGAGLLKWGGDALLLLFDGEGHERRACRAAWEMQRTLDRVGRLKAGGGAVTLRMSVGITTGTFPFFMVGSVHRELLIAGPATTETVTMEAIADAGEIALSHGLAARLDGSCVGPVKDAARLLAAPPEAERTRAPEVGDVSEIDIPSCIPIASRAHVLLERSEPEHRTITAAFIDLMDTDVLLERLGIDGLAEALDDRLCTIQEAALAYDVPFYESDVGKGSVKALLTAGAPSSTGHDEERMLRALREVMNAPGDVPLRIGVNTGKVFTGDFGPAYRRSYRVFGDAINTAARVMSRAEAGQLLSTEVVLERSRTTFLTTPIEPFAAKGKAQPVRASIVGEVTGTKEARGPETAFVGREVELDAMLAVVERARHGQGWVIELTGSPGLGKSRLVQEVLARSRDVTVLHSRCEEYEASTPYFAFRGLIRSVLGLGRDAQAEELTARLHEVVERSDPALVPWIPLLGILLGLDLPPTPETTALDERFLRERLGEVTMQFLFTLLAGTPTMIAVEDVHFMDEASRDLLLRLARANAELRHVILVTSSELSSLWAPTDEELIRTLSLCLLPLTLPRLVAIVEAATDDAPLSPHDVEEIARRSGGNTLFLFELVDAVRRDGSVEALPDSVESLVAGDIDRLAPEDRAVLRYAAVLGATFEPGLLADAVRAELDLDQTRLASLAEFVEPEPSGTWRFRNTLIRDAAYEGLPYRRRRELHGRIGRAIEARAARSGDDEAGSLALHFSEAQQWDKAWWYARLAAGNAMAIYANVEAARFAERALVAGRRLRSVSAADLAAVYEQLGDVRYRLGELERADGEFRAARRLVGGDACSAGRLALKQAKLSTRLGRYPQALRRMSRALARLDGVRGRDAAGHRARLYVWYGWTRYWQDRPAEAIEWLRRGEREARTANALDALAQAFQFLDAALTESGQIEQAVYSRRALEIYEDLGDLWQQAVTLNNMGVIAKELSSWAESRELYDRARELWETTGDRERACMAKYNSAEILSDQGRLDEAEALLREVLRVWRASGAETDAAAARQELGRLAARRGDFEAARALLQSARVDQVRAGEQRQILTTDTRLAEMLVYAGDGEGALALVDELFERVGDLHSTIHAARLLRLRGSALLQTGGYKEARTPLGEAIRIARARGDMYEAALTLDALGRLGRIDGDADAEIFETESRSLLDRLGVITIPKLSLSPGRTSPSCR
jgi:class 3 adenylate cyclase/tetratricopeptide (TPR) repeat protein